MTPNASRQPEAPHRRVTAPFGKFNASTEALCFWGGSIQSNPEQKERGHRNGDGTEQRIGTAAPRRTGSVALLRVPTADGADRSDGAARLAPPIPALCARPPRAAPRASPAAAPRSRDAPGAQPRTGNGGWGREERGGKSERAGGQRPERPEPRPDRTLTKSSMTGSLSPSFSPLTGTDSAMLQPSPPFTSPAAAAGTGPPPFASPAPRDCCPPRPALQRTAPRGREWGRSQSRGRDLIGGGHRKEAETTVWERG